MSNTIQAIGTVKPGDILIVQHEPAASTADLDGVAQALVSAGVKFVFMPTTLSPAACSAADIDRLEAALRSLKAT